MSHGGTTGSLFGPEALGRPRREVAPGAFWVPDWLGVRQQAWIVHAARELGRGPVPYHSAKIGNGQMSVSTLSLGWHWYPYGYSRYAVDVNGRRVADIPEWLVRLGQRAIEEVTGSREKGHAHTIDAALLNFYDTSARMGMHIDGEESVPDELWAEVVRHRGESGAGQVLMEIVTINAWNRIGVATRLDPRSLRGVAERDIDPERPEA